MSKIVQAIKRAAVALQLTAIGHENPSPVEGTEAAKVVPSDHDETREAKNNAVKVVTQLQQTAGGYVLTEEQRAIVIRAINAAGPPQNAFQENKDTGALTNFDGTPYISHPPPRIVPAKLDLTKEFGDGDPIVVLGDIGNELGKRAVSTAPPRKRDREGYIRYKKNR